MSAQINKEAVGENNGVKPTMLSNLSTAETQIVHAPCKGAMRLAKSDSWPLGNRLA